MQFIGWIIVGLVAGWLAGVITKTDRGLVGDLILGLVGAFIGGFITDVSVGDGSSIIPSIIVATIVAVILVVIKNMVLSRR